MPRTKLWIAAGLILAGLGVYLALHAGETEAPAPVDGTTQRGAASFASEPNAAASDKHRNLRGTDSTRQALLGETIIVQDATTGLPIGNATLIPAPMMSGGMIVTEEVPTKRTQRLHSDATGAVSIPKLRQHREWIVCAAGYLSDSIEQAQAGQAVALHSAAQLRVRVVDDESQPVANMVVALQPASSRAYLPEPVNRRHVAVGDPRRKVPVWIGRTNARGEFLFDTLPKGRYRMRTSHATYWASGAAAHGGKLVAAPGTALLETVPLRAAVAVAPPLRTLIEAFWHLPKGRQPLPRRPPGTQQAQRTLQKRFANAAIYLTTAKEPAAIECRASIDENGGAMANCPVVPIAQLEASTQLKATKNYVFRKVYIEVVDHSGTHLPAQVLAYDTERKAPQWTRSREPFLLRNGSYNIFLAEQANAAVPPVHGPLLVNGQSPHEIRFRVRLDKTHRMVELRPVGQKGSVPATLFYEFRLGDRSLSGVLDTSRRPFRWILPTGRKVTWRLKRRTIEPKTRRMRMISVGEDSFTVSPGKGLQRIELPVRNS